jgi:hypothetical protein
MALVTRQGKGSKLTIQEMDGNLEYLEQLAQTAVEGPQGLEGPQGPQGFQGVSGTTGPQGAEGPAGPQGVEGPAGPLGPVGPAGLQWQGSWVSGTTYVEDDAVGYDGASWFCILGTSGTTVPDIDTTHWALLASQGAQGPQGVQGISGATGPQGVEGPPGPSGGLPVLTNGTMFLTSGDDPFQTLEFDINRINLSSTSSVHLPADAPIGKEISVFVENSIYFLSVRGDNVLNLSFPFLIGSANQQTGTFPIFGSESYVFISLGSGLWRVNSISKTLITGSAATSITTKTVINATNVSVLDTTTLLGNSLFKDSLRFIRDNGSGTNKTMNLLSPTNIIDNRTITFPDATGTVALTSDVTLQKAKDNGNTISASTGTITSFTGSFIRILDPFSAGVSLGRSSLSFIRDNGSGTTKNINLIVPTNIIDDRNITLPDASGTVALTSNITLQNAINSGNTITDGYNTMTVTANSIKTNNSLGGQIEIVGGITTENPYIKFGLPFSAGKTVTLTHADTQSASRTIKLPDASGTVALQTYKVWRAVINFESVINVLVDEIGFTSPVITNPFNGMIIITKTGFFTSIDVNKLDLITATVNNLGAPYLCTLEKYAFAPNNSLILNVFDVTGGQTATPSCNFTVEIRIYN